MHVHTLWRQWLQAISVILFARPSSKQGGGVKLVHEMAASHWNLTAQQLHPSVVRFKWPAAISWAGFTPPISKGRKRKGSLKWLTAIVSIGYNGHKYIQSSQICPKSKFHTHIGIYRSTSPSMFLSRFYTLWRLFPGDPWPQRYPAVLDQSQTRAFSALSPTQPHNQDFFGKIDTGGGGLWH